MKGKHSRRVGNKIIWKIIMLVLIIVIVYSGYNIIIWLKSNNELDELENKVFSKMVIEEVSEETGEDTTLKTKTKIDFDSLKSMNNDVIGWISIENTNINYPVTQTTNNDYYLKRDINKKYNLCGNIFLDCNSKNDFSSQNSVIYGHTLLKGGMFTDLSKIYNGELGDEVYIKIYTPEFNYTYQVIAAYIAEPTKDIIRTSFNNNEKEQYIKNGIRKSKIKFISDVDYNKDMITLITCYGDNRTVVNALKIL